MAGALVLIGGIVWFGWKFYFWQPANVDPFTPQLTASLQFPLFHPTFIPTGFRVDTHSVSEPSTGVVVFYLDGPGKQRIYISEEARPQKYNIGGFFAKFSNLKESAIRGGTIATGKLGKDQMEVGSKLTNQDWIICNTSAPVPMSQLEQLVRGLTSNILK